MTGEGEEDIEATEVAIGERHRSQKMEEKEKKTNSSGYFRSVRSVFMHADCTDKWLMMFGFIGAVMDGSSTPVVLFFSSRLMNSIGTYASTDMTVFLNNVNKVFLKMLHPSVVTKLPSNN